MTESEKDSLKTEENNRPIIKDDEIDLIALLHTIWDGRKIIIKSTIIVLLIGLFIALFSPTEYTSTVKLIPETESQGSNLGQLGNLASQFGFGGVSGAGGKTGGIPPQHYPEIMKSLPFMEKLLDYEVYIPEAEEEMTLFYYFTEHRSASVVSSVKKYTIGLPFTILGALKGDKEEAEDTSTQGKDRNIISFSEKEWGVINQLRGLITVEMDDETGIVTVTANMPEDYLAADVADKVTEALVQYITDYRTQKLREDVKFIESRKEEASNRFEKAQEKLARFRDQSHGQLTQMAQTQEQRLQSEYDLAFNVYNTLAQRLEESRIKLQEETPVVKVIEPAAVPKEKSAPKIKLIMVVSLFLGVFIGIGIIFGKMVVGKFKEAW